MIKKIFIMLLFLGLINNIYSIEDEYSFKLSMNEKLKDKQVIKCDYILDNKKYSLNSKPSKQIKPIYKNINNNLSIKCNVAMDTINFELYKNDHKIKTETIKNKFIYTYKLNYNIVNINSYSKDCSINTNGIIQNLKTKKNKSKIETTFFNTFSLSCKTPTINDIYVYDKLGNEIYYNKLNTSLFNYDLIKSKSYKYNYELYFYDYPKIDNTCYLQIDNGKKIEIKTNKNTKLKDRTIKGDLQNSISLTCTKELKTATLFIIDKKTNKDISETQLVNTKTIQNIVN